MLGKRLKEILKKEKKKCIFYLISNFERSQCHFKSCPDNWTYFVSFMFLCHYSRCTNKKSHFQKMVAKIDNIHSIAWNIVYSIFSSINTKGYSIIYTWKFYLILSLLNNVEQQKPHCTELHIGLTSVSHWQVDASYFFLIFLLLLWKQHKQRMISVVWTTFRIICHYPPLFFFFHMTPKSVLCSEVCKFHLIFSKQDSFRMLNIQIDVKDNRAAGVLTPILELNISSLQMLPVKISGIYLLSSVLTYKM